MQNPADETALLKLRETLDRTSQNTVFEQVYEILKDHTARHQAKDELIEKYRSRIAELENIVNAKPPAP